jgi:hypothetical protein
LRDLKEPQQAPCTAPALLEADGRVGGPAHLEAAARSIDVPVERDREAGIGRTRRSSHRVIGKPLKTGDFSRESTCRR